MDLEGRIRVEEKDITTNKLGITFEIDVPNNALKSNLNTLVLLVRELIDIKECEASYELELKIKDTNSTIADIENILECMKYKEEQ